ncbi:MAG TPA: 30S ribosomal protein S20 [Actinomycetota bacterium]|jgi:small subunit ribosomal protein S20
MANIKSQKKRIITNERRRMRNKGVRTELRTYVKRFRQSVAGGDLDDAREALKVASRALDQAASKGVIHRNNAANRKSELARRLNRATRP